MLGASGACPEIRLNGKTWRVGHPTQRAKAALEVLAVAQAVAEIRELKGTLPPDAYAELFRELNTAIAAKHYKTWGDGWQRVVWGPQSAHLFLLSLLRENHPDATEEDALALAAGAAEEVAAALAVVVPPFVSLLLESRKDVPPEQRKRVLGEVAARLAPKVEPDAVVTTPPRPAPTPQTSAPSSTAPTKRSRKSPGAGTPTTSPA
jgi:hypothetical protein